MFAFVVAAVFLLLFGAGVLRDRRRFGNAVYLGLAVTFLGIGSGSTRPVPGSPRP
ncbi:hypothetical protein STANM309S_01899 [Streptomyces tanashiensis]